MDEAKKKYTLTDVKKTYKDSDAWWTVLLVDPVAGRLTLPVVNYTRITPNQISLLAFIVGLIAAYSFYQGSTSALIIGAILYHFSFILDCMDGKVARLKGTGSVFGMWLDYMLDRFRVVICTIGLMVGQYHLTGDTIYWYLALLVIFLDMTRYMDALQTGKLRGVMNKQIKKMRCKMNSTDTNNELLTKPINGTVERKRADLQKEFKSRFGWYLKIRSFFLNRRIRLHLFSGIEYMMFIFIVGPIFGLIKEITIISSIVFALFECAIIYKLWLSTKDFDRHMKELQHNEVQQ